METTKTQQPMNPMPNSLPDSTDALLSSAGCEAEDLFDAVVSWRHPPGF